MGQGERGSDRGEGAGGGASVNKRGEEGRSRGAEAMNGEQDGSAMNGEDWRRPLTQTHTSTYTHLDSHTQDRRKD